MAGAGFVACSNSSSQAGASEDPNQFTASIEGVVEKGPFVKGTTVTLYELNPETFAQTGKSFTGTIDNDDGAFSFGKVELESPYVLLDATGYYWNELNGERSSKPLTLRAIAHIREKDKVNVNIGTSIIYKRILDLVEDGLGFDEAKALAESELMDAFFGEEEGIEFEKASILDNEHLLALSQVVLSVGAESEIIEIIATLAKNLKDTTALVTLADRSAMKYEYGKSVRIFMNNRFPDAEIGPFEEYAITFWRHIYGLDPCVKENVGVLDTIHVSKSENDGYIVICKAFENDYRWEMATDVDVATVDVVPDNDGTIVFVENARYVYDGGVWREATESEIKVGLGCIKSFNDSLFMFDHDVRSCAWSEHEPYWRNMGISDVPKKFYFNESVKYDSVSDKRDGHVYRTVEINGKTWMAENLAYAADGADCSDSLTIGCFYDWHTALVVDENESFASGKNHRGICMEGFHVPDSTEWKTILDLIPLDNLKSYLGWSSGTNESGFSVVPMNKVSNFMPIEPYADFVIANYKLGEKCKDFGCVEKDAFVYGYAVAMDSSTEFALMEQRSKDDSRILKAALRCVKDSE